MELSNQEKGVLLLGAREAIKSLFYDLPPQSIDYHHYPNLKKPCGAFVTLTQNDELRGCIGYIQSNEPLFSTVCEVAKLAATEDPRFPPLSEHDIPHILIEISVLSQPEYVKNIEDIVLGKHGLILEDEMGTGLLLPQVAIEHKMTLSGFLSALCTKAGLPPNTWMSRPIKLKSFTAQVFGEQKRRNLTGESR